VANFTTGRVVFVTNGLNFPDALAGAPVAGSTGGPILLVTPTGVPTSTEEALAVLKPLKIVMLGGENSVSRG
jgi:putative cell wall-binding protein